MFKKMLNVILEHTLKQAKELENTKKLFDKLPQYMCYYNKIFDENEDKVIKGEWVVISKQYPETPILSFYEKKYAEKFIKDINEKYLFEKGETNW